jgi:ATP-binding cassette subfamily B protein
MSIGENIGIGDTPSMKDNVAICTAAEIGGALEFVKDFPDTFQTVMANRYTAGSQKNHRDLSGGQWQRLALSRTFMRISSADLLLLDEPSASLDPEAEFQLFKKLKELRRGRTTVYISHRFNTVRAATRIMV